MDKQVVTFLKQLKENNNREWFAEHKSAFEEAKNKIHQLFTTLYNNFKVYDTLEPLKIYRIYRDVRFSVDKTPYKTHFSMYIGRLKPDYRGGYYVHIEPGNSFVGIGFFDPNKEDLLRIRKEIELDNDLEHILSHKSIKTTFGDLAGEEVKTAPKGFSKDHERIAILKKKQFLLIHQLTDAEILSADFPNKVNQVLQLARPFVDYMTDVLLTDLNGERK